MLVVMRISWLIVSGDNDIDIIDDEVDNNNDDRDDHIYENNDYFDWLLNGNDYCDTNKIENNFG